MEKHAFLEQHKDLLESARAELDAMALPAVSFNAGAGPAGLFDSRMGGPIAWPPGEPVPEDATGGPMIMAIQINLAEMPTLPDFPETGLIQLFLAHDVMTRWISTSREQLEDGGFPLRNGDGFRLVYRRDLSLLTETRYKPVTVDFPVASEAFVARAIPLVPGAVYLQIPPVANWLSAPILERLEDATKGEDIERRFWLQDALWAQEDVDLIYLGGHSFSIQVDQRQFFEDYRIYDCCLLKFGEYYEGLNLESLFPNLLISEADLKRGALENVVMIADTD